MLGDGAHILNFNKRTGKEGERECEREERGRERGRKREIAKLNTCRYINIFRSIFFSGGKNRKTDTSKGKDVNIMEGRRERGGKGS